MQVKVFNTEAKEVGEINLKDEVFACDYNEALIHQVVVAQMANARQGTKSTLTRSEVRGGGIKPYRQKGTGRARQGSTRAPQHVGGGVVFAKKPRDFSQKISKTMRQSAFLSAISEKIRQSEVTVLDKLALKEAKTKLFQNVIDALKLKGKTIFVTDGYEETLIRAIKNIPDAKVEEVRTLSVYDIVANRNLVMTKSAIEKIEEANK